MLYNLPPPAPDNEKLSFSARTSDWQFNTLSPTLKVKSCHLHLDAAMTVSLFVFDGSVQFIPRGDLDVYHLEKSCCCET